MHVHRPDRVVVSLPGAGGRWSVPHDLAHFATERALGLADGVFGSIAAGAMFEQMSVVAGRLRHDPRERSQVVLRTNTKSRSITVAETMTSVVHDAVQHGQTNGMLTRARRVWGTVREDPFPYTDKQFRTAMVDLQELRDRWAEARVGSPLVSNWPDRLVTELPTRSRSGRR